MTTKIPKDQLDAAAKKILGLAYSEIREVARQNALLNSDLAGIVLLMNKAIKARQIQLPVDVSGLIQLAVSKAREIKGIKPQRTKGPGGQP